MFDKETFRWLANRWRQAALEVEHPVLQARYAARAERYQKLVQETQEATRH